MLPAAKGPYNSFDILITAFGQPEHDVCHVGRVSLRTSWPAFLKRFVFRFVLLFALVFAPFPVYYTLMKSCHSTIFACALQTKQSPLSALL